MRLTSEFVQAVRTRIADNPFCDTAAIAREQHMPEAYVIMAMPIAMRVRVKAADIGAVWQGIGEMKQIALTPPQQEDGCLAGASALCPKQENLGFIWFVSLPSGLNGEYEHSIRFFDMTGHHLLSVGLRNTKSSSDEQIFQTLKTLYGITPKPPKRHACKGCGRCTPATCCQGKGHHHEHHHKANSQEKVAATSSACA